MKSKPPIFFSSLTSERLDVIRPLWEQLNRHHATLPTPFAPEIATRSFESRLRAFRDKAASGSLHVEVALASRELAVATTKRMEFNWCEDVAP